ncbi:hypothetical protein RCO28_34445 [Streptomyces sp. LHD-70]|uniref:hypothetical protein n=1 Tax=Streptomyces sp. LHD-70 TaxID=3072140 RepID=UPI00280C74C7|nr:hypothetical protein [Streptomyces sp. LHD-70]MDQ8707533.1 hypothetical protein [Streptomyces sp. LHD-70]
MSLNLDWWRAKGTQDDPQPEPDHDRPDMTPDPNDPAGEWWADLYGSEQRDTFNEPTVIVVEKNDDQGQLEEEEEPPTLRERLNSRAWRIFFFNGSAAALGIGLGLGTYLGEFPEHAVQAAPGLLGTAGALGCGYAGWKAARSKTLADVLPASCLGGLIRLGLVFGLAELGRRGGVNALPAISAYIAQYSPLTAHDIALLTVGAAMCGGTGYLAWRYRHTPLHKRWLARIPLATSVLTLTLHGSDLLI